MQGQQVDQIFMGMDDMSADLDDKIGSFDEGDPQTTNLYVGNLAPQVIFHYDTHFVELTLSELLLADCSYQLSFSLLLSLVNFFIVYIITPR